MGFLWAVNVMLHRRGEGDRVGGLLGQELVGGILKHQTLLFSRRSKQAVDCIESVDMYVNVMIVLLSKDLSNLC